MIQVYAGFMHVCMHTYACLCIHVFQTHVSTPIYIYIYIYIYEHVCLCVYTYSEYVSPARNGDSDCHVGTTTAEIAVLPPNIIKALVVFGDYRNEIMGQVAFAI
jgi:hypothetical protein